MDAKSDEPLDMEIIVKDKHDRIIIKVIKEKVMVTRYTDMDEYTKNQIVTLYAELTGENDSNLMLFLNFESSKNEFCS